MTIPNQAIQFARLISYITSLSNGSNFMPGEIAAIAQMVDDCQSAAPAAKNYIAAEPINALLSAMATGRKIEAIKEYRSLTGFGLKESKDAVQRYWLDQTATQYCTHCGYERKVRS